MRRLFILVTVSIVSLFILFGCDNENYDTMKDDIQSEINDDIDSRIDEKIEDANGVNLDNFYNHMETVSAEIQQCTVGIEVYYNDESSSLGSGVLYKHEDDTYYILTNEHVIRHYDAVYIYLYEDSTRYQAEVLKTSPENDLAILTIQYSETIDVCQIKAQSVAVGHIVLAVGTAVEKDYFNAVTLGVVSNIAEDYIQHDAAINSGNSGGPLFNLHGEIIGLNVSKLSTTSIGGRNVTVEGVGFAIPLDGIIAFIS